MPAQKNGNRLLTGGSLMELVSQLSINGLTLGLSYVLMALGLTIIFSIMGIVNFAHGEFYMLGAFAIFVTVTTLYGNFFLGLLCAIVALGVIGILAERIVFRKFSGQHLNGLVASLGLSILLQNAALLIWGGDDQAVASPFRGKIVEIWGIITSVERLMVAGASIIALLLVYYFITYTKLGQAMRAMSQDKEAAALQGIPINRISSMSFALGCILAGMAGALLAPIYYVSPFIGAGPVLKAFVVIVLGGLGSIFGAVVGGLILGMIDSVSVYFWGTLGDLVGFVILISFIMFRPTGLFGNE
jgi:branched-chain amino acid transport system permease protein